MTGEMENKHPLTTPPNKRKVEDMSSLSPLHLKLLLHAYTHCEPWPHNGGCALEYEEHLATAGLVKLSDDGKYYQCTGMGEAHIWQILNLPLPIPGWMDANGKTILPSFP
jgi:hypothetical protein